MQTRPLFLRISGLSGVLKAFLLEGIGNYPVTPPKKKKHVVDIDVAVEGAATELVASDVQVDVGEASTSGPEHAHGTDAVPLAGRKRDLVCD